MKLAPTAPYNGITIVIDKPSRFDSKTSTLFSSQPAQFFDDEILAPDYKLQNCHILEAKESLLPLLPHTKHIWLLGEQSATKYNFNIDHHGYPATLFNLPCTIGYYPQDCCDIKNVEWDQDEDEDEEAISDRDIKDSAPTRRSNYRFWTRWHLRRALYSNYQNPPQIQPIYYASLNDLTRLFKSIENEDLYLDIETSRIHHCWTCIGLSSTSLWPKIYVVPIYLHSGDRAYSDIYSLYRLLFTLLKRNTIVGHNLSFDLLVLRAFYKLPLPVLTPHDTLLANHRIFPEVERSLAHTIAMWLCQKYHKDVSTEVFNNKQQQDMWEYNAWDVYSLKLIKDAQLQYASSRPGLTESIAQANEMLVPYLYNSILGLNLDLPKLTQAHTLLTKTQAVYAQICALLTGIKDFNPGSSLQCRKFYHDQLSYPVIAKSNKPPFNPKLGKKQLYQLLIKTNNPSIKAVLKYRKTAKDASMLESELWTSDLM